MRAFTCAAIALVATGLSVTTAFSQAGSTGGTVGKQDKSISGGEEQTAPAKQHAPSRRSADTRANTKSTGSGCGPILGKWLFSNGVTVIVNANRTTTQSDGFSATVSCADGVYTFNWPIGSATVTLSADGRTISGTSSVGPASASRL